MAGTRVLSSSPFVLLREADPPSSLSWVTDLGCRRLRHTRFSSQPLPPVRLSAFFLVGLLSWETIVR